MRGKRVARPAGKECQTVVCGSEMSFKCPWLPQCGGLQFSSGAGVSEGSVGDFRPLNSPGIPVRCKT